MSTGNKIIPFLIGLFLLTTNIAFAKGEDVKGSNDHPLISRYPGAVIKYYDMKEFDKFTMPLGKIVEGKLSNSLQLEGKITRIQYNAPQNRSTLEIYRNYKMTLENAGFNILFTDSGRELGRFKKWPDIVYKTLNPIQGDYKYRLRGEDDSQYYLSAKLVRPQGDIYVSLYISQGWYKWPVIQFDVIEVKPIETGMVTQKAEAMAEKIARVGHAAVYGIYFDTDKAYVKPESEPLLREITRLLRYNPELNLYVVGHTDNVGSLDYNMKLSKRRAEAVVKVLVFEHGVDRKRLSACGVGLLAPVASNKAEYGRSRNRRVELVEQ